MMSSTLTESGNASTSGTFSTADSYRHWLKVAVGSILTEIGFGSAEPRALEILCEMIQSLIYELGRSSRAFAELACRSEPLGADVVLAMVEMGMSMNGLKEFAFRAERKSFPPPSVCTAPKPSSILHTGDRKQRVKTHYIPDHFPELPDSHSFVRTATHKQPITDYESVREKASGQKRDVERALTRFIAKTGKTHSVFNSDDKNLYPLISCDRSMGPVDSPELPPYLNALIFKDQIFEEDERDFLPKKQREELEDKARAEKAREVKKRKESSKKRKKEELLVSQRPPETEEKKESVKPIQVIDYNQDNQDNPFIKFAKKCSGLKHKKILT